MDGVATKDPQIRVESDTLEKEIQELEEIVERVRDRLAVISTTDYPSEIVEQKASVDLSCEFAQTLRMKHQRIRSIGQKLSGMLSRLEI